METNASQWLPDTHQGFLADRLIDNAIEWAFTKFYSTLSAKKRAYLLLLDFAEAFPSINHVSIRTVLSKFGMPDFFINMVMLLYEDVSHVAVLAGCLFAGAAMLSGIRQGDPSSPILLILIMEILAFQLRMLGIDIKCFADDVALFFEGLLTLQAIRQALDDFRWVSGMRIKPAKSFLLPTIREGVWEVAEIEAFANWGIGFCNISYCERYLGLKIGLNATVFHNFEGPLNKFRIRVIAWKSVFLGHSSRIWVLNTWILPVFSFVIRFFIIPEEILKEVWSTSAWFVLHGRTLPARVLPYLAKVFHFPVGLRALKYDNWAFLFERACRWIEENVDFFQLAVTDLERALPLSFPSIVGQVCHVVKIWRRVVGCELGDTLGAWWASAARARLIAKSPHSLSSVPPHAFVYSLILDHRVTLKGEFGNWISTRLNRFRPGWMDASCNDAIYEALLFNLKELALAKADVRVRWAAFLAFINGWLTRRRLAWCGTLGPNVCVFCEESEDSLDHFFPSTPNDRNACDIVLRAARKIVELSSLDCLGLHHLLGLVGDISRYSRAMRAGFLFAVKRAHDTLLFGKNTISIMERIDLISNFFKQVYKPSPHKRKKGGMDKPDPLRPGVVMPLTTNLAKRRRLSTGVSEFAWIPLMLRVLGVQQTGTSITVSQMTSLVKLELLAGHDTDLCDLLEYWVDKLEIIDPKVFKAAVSCAWLGDGAGLGLDMDPLVRDVADPEACAAQCGRKREVLFGGPAACRCRVCLRHWCRFCVGIHECRYCQVALPPVERRLRRAACFDFSLFVDFYCNNDSPERNVGGFLAVDVHDVEVGHCINPYPGYSQYDCALKAFAACFRFISHFHNEDPSRRTFQLVHHALRAVRAIAASSGDVSDQELSIARELYQALPPSIWLVWDAGRRRKSDNHFNKLRKKLHPQQL
jgi:hypothetical protein